LKKFYSACSVDDLKPGKGLKIRVKGKTIALFRHKNKIYAMQNSCPHQNADLSDGYIKNDKVYCQLHHWAFELATGSYSFNPKIFINTFEVKISNDVIFVGIDNY